jgi:hypothetical protein
MDNGGNCPVINHVGTTDQQVGGSNPLERAGWQGWLGWPTSASAWHHMCGRSSSMLSPMPAKIRAACLWRHPDRYGLGPWCLDRQGGA